jgi:Leucine-rich repeat (LRR) protein
LLDELPSGLFSKQSSLQFLNLTYNNLVELPFDIFSQMTNLANLSLNINVIEEIDARLFASLRSLNLLDLSIKKYYPTKLSNVKELYLNETVFVGMRKLNKFVQP